MRKINVREIQQAVRDLCLSACIEADMDLLDSLRKGLAMEVSPQGKEVLQQLIDNAGIAHEEQVPLCQDTGFSVIFLEIGQEVQLWGGNLSEAVNEGVALAYTQGYLRKSIIADPLTNPHNSQDNTPAIIHTRIVDGDKVKITVLPKGGGAENMSRIKMLKPADGLEGIKEFVLATVREAGSNPCPPVFVGVGIGGTFDHAAFLAKKALLRPIGQRHAQKKIAEYEINWLQEVNNLGIGPGGLGGRITALDLFIEVFPRHIASLPAAVNLQCHANRKKTVII